ncbi:uncharacterized protein LOC143545980 [Bidens hawaiensis]|uniref:uncharacterized protein LOC143545980 n=1 Tax=Bidens hawaiensis TaxID=980011 RepID=UPI0040491497
MLTVQSPVTETHLPWPKPTRRPLQPLKSHSNIPPPPPNPRSINKDIQNEKIDRTSYPEPNGSPGPTVSAAPVQIEQFEVSLADELNAIREKMERLKADRERTEKMLNVREVMMEMKMKELEVRGEIQKVLEIEVDRLYRLNELRSVCNRILPIRSLREKEQEKIKPDKLQGVKIEEREAKGQGSI